MLITELVLVGYKRLALNNIEYFKISPERPIQLILGTNGSGKALPLDANIKTPSGWSTMSQMAVGTKVIAKDGSTTTVTGVFPQGKLQMYKLTFDDGRTVEACADHLWKVYHPNPKTNKLSSVVNTLKMLHHISIPNREVFIDLIDPEDSKLADLHTDPYELGCKIGIDNITTNFLSIPNEYMHASYNQRLALLQGLLDIDGYYSSIDGTVEYVTSMELIAEDVQYLVRSIGGLATLSTEYISHIKATVYKVKIKVKNPTILFQMVRKVKKATNFNHFNPTLKLRVVSIEPSRIIDAQCISIAHPDKLFVTNDFIVTHNSSIMQELSPLPADSKDFKKGGSKQITIEHHNSKYVLKSNFEHKQEHSFIKDGEELNTGYTVTVQKDLVKKYFNITPIIHELLLNQKAFTLMGSNERRVWFTRLSDTNYDYAISIFMKLKEKHRDFSGALKITKKRLVTEVASLITDTEQKLLQVQVNDLHEFINHLLQYRTPIDTENYLIQNQFNKNISDIGHIGNRLTSYLKKLSVQLPEVALDSLDSDILDLQSSKSIEVASNNKNMEMFNDLQQKVLAIKTAGSEDINSLLSKLSILSDKRITLLEKIKINQVPISANDASRALETVLETLTTVFSTLPINLDKKYSRINLENTNSELLLLKNTLETSIQKLNHLEIQKATQITKKEHDKATCPNCKHNWSIGFSELVYQNILTDIDTTQEVIDESTIIIKEKELFIQEIKDYFNLYKDFNQLTTKWDILKSLWSYILSDDIIFSNPKTIINRINNFKYELSILSTVEALDKEILELKNLISLSEKIGNDDVNKVLKDSENLELSIETSTNRINTITKSLNHLLGIKNDLNTIFDLANTTKLLLNDFNTNHSSLNENYRREALNEIIKKVQISLSRKECILSEVKLQKSLVTDLENQIHLMEKEEEAYKILVKELSPTDGLIAQGMMGFINTFVKQMNQLIKKIWQYPLVIKSCAISEDGAVDLDYLFPLMVQSLDNVVSDVVKGSSAMKEIIDLAFKITAMKYLNLSDSPIMLDEFGKTMDHEHRIKSSDFVKSLIEQQPFTQLYMVSHYEESYGSLVNADICILNENNIVIPPGCIFNKHVVME